MDSLVTRQNIFHRRLRQSRVVQTERILCLCACPSGRKQGYNLIVRTIVDNTLCDHNQSSGADAKKLIFSTVFIVQYCATPTNMQCPLGGGLGVLLHLWTAALLWPYLRSTVYSWQKGAASVFPLHVFFVSRLERDDLVFDGTCHTGIIGYISILGCLVFLAPSGYAKYLLPRETDQNIFFLQVRNDRKMYLLSNEYFSR